MTEAATPVLPFGSTIGIIGGGQLARMMASAAARLGFRTVVLDPDSDCPAAQTSNRVIAAPYDDRDALAELARCCAVITYEFENVPVAPLAVLSEIMPVRPAVGALEVSQDRVVEKAFLNGIGIETAPWRAIDDEAELAHALLDLGGDCILKTRRLGYDGKGQAVLKAGAPIDGVLDSLGRVPSILEKRITFEREVSVIAARALDGSFATYDLAENVHRAGILRRSSVPATLDDPLSEAARDIAARIMERLGYVGVLGVEFFVSGGRLLVNEIAPRVHNSGHWTDAACSVSQFEQHIRAVAGLPLGNAKRHSDAVMENLIGDEIVLAASLVAQDDAVVTLYGKGEARPGRKMGHVTRLTRSKR